jgi:glucose-1-phosphate adenylyltransferase
MGNDYYELPEDASHRRSNGSPPLGIGQGTTIEGAIIDKNCRIGSQSQIVNRRQLKDTDEAPYGMVRDGILVIPKDTTLPDGWTL